MAKKKRNLDAKIQAWVDARKRHRLSPAHIHMARELGMKPKKFGKLDNHRQEPWKAPLPIFIERLYEKRFGRSRPERVITIEELARGQARKKEAKKQAKAMRRAAALVDGANKRAPPVPEGMTTVNDTSRTNA